MKPTVNMMIMGFLVVGLWYSIGYIQGAEQNREDVFQAGKRAGEQDSASKDDE